MNRFTDRPSCSSIPSTRPLELILDLPSTLSSVPPVSAVRGTIILASTRALRELELFEQYRIHLLETSATAVLGVTAGEWVSLEVATAHYRACEELQLTPSLQLEVGFRAGKRALGTMLGTAMRLSRFAGATPWTIVQGADRIWNRAYEGGALRIYRAGETEALVEVHKNSLMTNLEFCRNSFRGFCVALYELVSERMSCRVLNVTPQEVQYRVVWR